MIDDDFLEFATPNKRHTNVRVVNVRHATKKDFDEWRSEKSHAIRGILTKDTKEYSLITHESTEWADVGGNRPRRHYDENMIHWRSMPEFESKLIKPYSHIFITISDETQRDFEQLVGQSITDKTQSIMIPPFPKKSPESFMRYVSNVSDTIPRFPIYVVSKNRHNTCFTSIHLSLMEIPHYIVVEPSQIDLYKSSNTLNFTYANLLEMDMSFYDDYDTCDELGNSKSKGPGASRNFAWDHSIKNNNKYHWVMDDNAEGGFFRLHKNKKIRLRTGAGFKSIEDFVERFDNVGLSGLQYMSFANANQEKPPFALNTRIYSFLLIKNDIPYRWRGRYNEDTDLSLRILKDGLCTIQFNTILSAKATTQKFSGGNTDEFYKKEGTYEKSKMLYDLHPDVTTMKEKFGRIHHSVSYTKFKQKLSYVTDISEYNPLPNEYGMVLINTHEKIGRIKYENSLSYLNAKYRCDDSYTIDIHEIF